MNKEKLIKDIYDGVKIIAWRHSYSKEQMEDMLQEGIIAALEAIDKYSDKNYNELIKIIAKSAYNRIFTFQRKEINIHKKFSELHEGIIDKMPLPDSSITTKDFVRVLSTRLSSIQRRVLREKLTPSKNTFKIIDEELRNKLLKRNRGQLVMNVRKTKITDTHIAKSLKIGKATVSRASKQILIEAQYLNSH